MQAQHITWGYPATRRIPVARALVFALVLVQVMVLVAGALLVRSPMTESQSGPAPISISHQPPDAADLNAAEVAALVDAQRWQGLGGARETVLRGAPADARDRGAQINRDFGVGPTE